MQQRNAQFPEMVKHGCTAVRLWFIRDRESATEVAHTTVQLMFHVTESLVRTNFDVGCWNVVLVKSQQRLKKLHVSEHLLGRTPEVLDLAAGGWIVDAVRFDALQHAQCLTDEFYTGRGALHRLDYCNVGRSQRVERRDGGVEDWHRLRQVRVTLVLDSTSSFGLLVGHRLDFTTS